MAPSRGAAPVGGVKVSVVAIGTSSAPLVGTTTTDAKGRWSFAVPSYSSLPAQAQAAAQANDGYLNLDVIAMINGKQSTDVAVGTRSAWVGAPSAVRPLVPASGIGPAMTLQVSTAGGGAKSNCCAPDGCGFVTKPITVAKGAAWTVIGEYHANWDAQAGVSYTQGGSSNIGSYIGWSGKDFDFSGYETFSTSRSISTGGKAGPFNSHQTAIKMKYKKLRLNETNLDNSNIICRWFAQIMENGLWDRGGQVIKSGKNVYPGHDGLRFCLAAKRNHPRWVAWWGNDQAFFYQLDSGKGVTYGAAADVFGVGVQAETDHSTEVDTEIDWGQSSRVDGCNHRHHDGRHYIWGSNANPVDFPKTFYSY